MNTQINKKSRYLNRRCTLRRKGTKVVIGIFSKDTNLHLNGTMQPLGVRYKGIHQ